MGTLLTFLHWIPFLLNTSSHWISHCSYFCTTVITLFIFLKRILLLTLLIFLQYCTRIVHISTLDIVLKLFISLHWVPKSLYDVYIVWYIYCMQWFAQKSKIWNSKKGQKTQLSLCKLLQESQFKKKHKINAKSNKVKFQKQSICMYTQKCTYQRNLKNNDSWLFLKFLAFKPITTQQ